MELKYLKGGQGRDLHNIENSACGIKVAGFICLLLVLLMVVGVLTR